LFIGAVSIGFCRVCETVVVIVVIGALVAVDVDVADTCNDEVTEDVVKHAFDDIGLATDFGCGAYTLATMNV
jgi:hypothetical protein